MNEKYKSIIRHVLTTLGAIAGFASLGWLSDVVNFIVENLDQVEQWVVGIIGFVTTLVSFFHDKGERFKVREEAK